MNIVTHKNILNFNRTPRSFGRAFRNTVEIQGDFQYDNVDIGNMIEEFNEKNGIKAVHSFADRFSIRADLISNNSRVDIGVKNAEALQDNFNNIGNEFVSNSGNIIFQWGTQLEHPDLVDNCKIHVCSDNRSLLVVSQNEADYKTMFDQFSCTEKRDYIESLSGYCPEWLQGTFWRIRTKHLRDPAELIDLLDKSVEYPMKFDIEFSRHSSKLVEHAILKRIIDRSGNIRSISQFDHIIVTLKKLSICFENRDVLQCLLDSSIRLRRLIIRYAADNLIISCKSDRMDIHGIVTNAEYPEGLKYLNFEQISRIGNTILPRSVQMLTFIDCATTASLVNQISEAINSEQVGTAQIKTFKFQNRLMTSRCPEYIRAIKNLWIALRRKRVLNIHFFPDY